MKIDVTQAMIDVDEMSNFCSDCPVAQAIGLVLNERYVCQIDGRFANIWGKFADLQERILLPIVARTFIMAFDNAYVHTHGRRPSPFSFELPIPSTYLKEAA